MATPVGATGSEVWFARDSEIINKALWLRESANEDLATGALRERYNPPHHALSRRNEAGWL